MIEQGDLVSFDVSINPDEKKLLSRVFNPKTALAGIEIKSSLKTFKVLTSELTELFCNWGVVCSFPSKTDITTLEISTRMMFISCLFLNPRKMGDHFEQLELSPDEILYVSQLHDTISELIPLDIR